MSSSLDDHIRSVLDGLRVTLSGQLEAELTASTGDIVRAVADQHRQAPLEATERAAAEARLEAEQQLSAVRSEFDRQREDLARDKDGLQQATAFEIAGLERLLSEVRDERDALRLHLEQIQQDHESRARQLRDSIERVGRDAEQTRVEADTSARELAGVRARLTQTTRLTSAMRTLDEATSLGDILDNLAYSASQESGRTAVFLVNGQKLRGWRALGFESGLAIVGSDFEPAEAGVVGQAVRLGIGQQHRNGDVAHLPSFALDSGPRDAVALPVQVGGSVIAVLYADAARTDRPEDPEWLDTIDAMTKHAGRVLEAMTVCQAAELWTTRHGPKR